MTKNQNHVHGRNSEKAFPGNAEVDVRDLEKRNEARSAGLPSEEPRNVHKAGGGTLGKSLGGAHTGRYGGAPGKVESNRTRKPRGNDKDD